MKDNPKLIQAQKEGKAPMEYLVYSVLEDDAWCHKHGGDKYGIRNWTKDKILSSTYEGAILRHFLAWASGEDIDPDSGRPHLTHMRACGAVVMDAQKHGTLIGDRNRVESKDGDIQQRTDNTDGGVWPTRACEDPRSDQTHKTGYGRRGLFTGRSRPQEGFSLLEKGTY